MDQTAVSEKELNSLDMKPATSHVIISENEIWFHRLQAWKGSIDTIAGGKRGIWEEYWLKEEHQDRSDGPNRADGGLLTLPGVAQPLVTQLPQTGSESSSGLSWAELAPSLDSAKKKRKKNSLSEKRNGRRDLLLLLLLAAKREIQQTKWKMFSSSTSTFPL